MHFTSFMLQVNNSSSYRRRLHLLILGFFLGLLRLEITPFSFLRHTSRCSSSSSLLQLFHLGDIVIHRFLRRFPFNSLPCIPLGLFPQVEHSGAAGIHWSNSSLLEESIENELVGNSGATCIAYETIEKPDGSLPILAPMSEIAGRLSIQMGMRFLEKTNGGSGILLAGVPGVLPGTVVVIGGGVAGANAAIVAAGTGARVILMDNNIARLRQLAAWMPNNVQTAFSSSASIEQHLAQADLAVGAALVAGARAPVLVSEAALRSMKPGSVFVDIAIDQGGMTAASKPTTHRDPVLKVGDTTLYCVANMPGCVPRTSTEAITNAATPYLMQIAKLGWGAALSADPGLLLGLNVTE